MKKILLHVCCADCGLKMLAGADEENEIMVYYYNPNIHPRSEYLSRLAAVQKMIKNKIIVPDWRPEEYFKNIDAKDRCQSCWQLRLRKTAEYAAKNGFDGFGSTLVASKYQQREKIIEIGEDLARKYKLVFWQPKEINCELKTSGFYKQFFCGCVYSLRERFEEKYK